MKATNETNIDDDISELQKIIGNENDSPDLSEESDSEGSTNNTQKSECASEMNVPKQLEQLLPKSNPAICVANNVVSLSSQIPHHQPDTFHFTSNPNPMSQNIQVTSSTQMLYRQEDIPNNNHYSTPPNNHYSIPSTQMSHI